MRPLRLTGVTAPIVLSVLMLVSCTSGSTPRGSGASSSVPTPRVDRLTQTCEFLSDDSTLRKVIRRKDGWADWPRRTHGAPISCGFNRRVSAPVAGVLVVWAEVKVIDPQDPKVDRGAPNLTPCVSGARCWLSTPTECQTEKTDPPDTDFRNHVARAESAPYTVKIEVGLWPEKRKDLCRADAWSKVQSARLLRKTLTYLTAD